MFLGKGKPKSVGERHLPLPQALTPSAFLADNKRKYADFPTEKGAGKEKTVEASASTVFCCFEKVTSTCVKSEFVLFDLFA